MGDYSGGRSYDDLKEFAGSNLGPQCGPGENYNLCSDAIKKKIDKYLKMSVTELEEGIQKIQDKVKIDVPLMAKAKAWIDKKNAPADPPADAAPAAEEKPAEAKTDL